MVEKQTMRFSNADLKLLKSTFAERDDVIFALRKFFLQLPMHEREDVLLKNAITQPVWDVIKKSFLPELEGDLPLHQEVDLLLTVKVDNMSPDVAGLNIKARLSVIDYMRKMMSKLKGQDVAELINLNDIEKELDSEDDAGALYANLLARNTIVSHVEQQLSTILILAGRKNETEEETMKRLKQNSAK